MYQDVFSTLKKSYNLELYPSSVTFERNLESLDECIGTSFLLFCDDIRKKIEHDKSNAVDLASKP